MTKQSVKQRFHRLRDAAMAGCFAVEEGWKDSSSYLIGGAADRTAKWRGSYDVPAGDAVQATLRSAVRCCNVVGERWDVKRVVVDSI